MRYAIIGAGGIGAYYGARLQDNGHDVIFLARGAHLRALRQKGLVVRHPDWQFAAPVRALSLDEFLETHVPGDVDVLVLAIKAIDTRRVAHQLAPWLGDSQAVVLSLQNGVDNEPVLAEIVGVQRVLGGLAVRIGSHIVDPGVVEAVGPAQVITGVWPNAQSDGQRTRVLRQIVAEFNEAGIPTQLTEDIQRELWRKLVINNGVNPLSALTHLDTRTLSHDPGMSVIVYGMMQEARLAAAADGVTLSEADGDEMFQLIRQFDAIKTSMLVDVEQGKAIELDEICGAVLERSAQLGIQAPFTHTIYHLLRHMLSATDAPGK